MDFNPHKCEHIRITNKRKIIQTTYKIYGQVLKETTKAKYIGVTIDKTLSWNNHIDMVTKRANQTIFFFTEKPVIMSIEYKRSQLQDPRKTSARVCDYSLGPIYKDNKVEAVQRRAARFCHYDYRQTSSINSMIQNLGWEDLQHRRDVLNRQ